MTVSPRALLHLLAILAAAGTFATRATCYAELPWLVRFGRGALAMTVVTGIYSRIGRNGTAKAATPLNAVPDLSRPGPRFNCDAGHEMKTPLTGIKAYLELLADGDAVDEATRAEFLRGMGSQVERLERAVAQLLCTTSVRAAADCSPEMSFFAQAEEHTFAEQKATIGRGNLSSDQAESETTL
jgi:signal transduction histidine kinase